MSKKIAILGGAYKNAGDFLIEKRSHDLLKEHLKECDITLLKRNINYSDRIDELNEYDALVFSGGPGYQPAMYPNAMPFVDNLDEISAPLFIMGWGWKGLCTDDYSVYQNYKLFPGMLSFLHKVQSSGLTLGCRDWYTKRVLKKNGLTDLIMTGCPAWYDLEYVDQTKLSVSGIGEQPVICISDPAFTSNTALAIRLIRQMREQYPSSIMKYVFHRGMTKENEVVMANGLFDQLDVEAVDISGSVDGFSVYDQCDLHIGFRVHAHIYSLSKRRITILINEDARGNGVNHALGLEDVNVLTHYKTRAENLLNKKSETQNFEERICDYLEYIQDSDYKQYRTAFHNMQDYYEVMKKHIHNIENKW